MTASILQQIAGNDQAAMNECLTRYGGLVWSLVLRRCLNRADAEDVVQDVFLDVWKSAHRYDPAVANEATFIAMVTRRRLIDRARRVERRVDESPLAASTEPAVTTDNAVEVSDEVSKVRRAMGELSKDERTVIEMAIDRGLSQSEISEQTQLPLGTVKSHARRGMMRLKSALGVDESVKGGVR